MELLGNFGFDPLMLGAQIVNFLIILFVLRKFLYKPVQDMLNTRQNLIKEGVRNAEESKLLLEKARNEEIEILKNAQNQARKLLEDVKKQSIILTKQSEESAKKQSERMLQEAKLQILQETEKAEAKLTVQVSKLSVKILEKALVGLVSEKEQNELMKKTIKELQRQTN